MTNGKLLAAAFLTMAMVSGACSPGPDGGSDNPKIAGLTGSINADGSSTVFPISQAIAELFNEEAPGVKVSVGTSGTGGGFEKFCAGETDISNASRQIKDEEKQACAQRGVEFIELQVAIDGLSVVVNPSNTFAKCLSVEELKNIWAPGSQIDNWSKVRRGFPNRPLTLYGPGTDSGTFDYFTEAVVGKEGASRNDYTASENDNDLVIGVAGDQNALGYFGFGYFEQNKDKLKALSIRDGGECVRATIGTIESGKYKPLSRPLFVYVAKKAAGRPEVSAFIDFYLETVAEIVPDVGYVAAPEGVVEKETQKWQAFRGRPSDR